MGGGGGGGVCMGVCVNPCTLHFNELPCGVHAADTASSFKKEARL